MSLQDDDEEEGEEVGRDNKAWSYGISRYDCMSLQEEKMKMMKMKMMMMIMMLAVITKLGHKVSRGTTVCLYKMMMMRRRRRRLAVITKLGHTVSRGTTVCLYKKKK